MIHNEEKLTKKERILKITTEHALREKERGREITKCFHNESHAFCIDERGITKRRRINYESHLKEKKKDETRGKEKRNKKTRDEKREKVDRPTPTMSQVRPLLNI